ncbi:GNAT family N-acetyltransferase [Sagittula stellata]|uniref:Acetyltransferase, GNAT family protein n=1 Tax=Sagittula stellata (strain ATCC 700073 / DSM 11524 / E-37) TaxID=388399 RepID=A3KAB9_SAGS3|nr:GNAT family N-acetyltransferase [Sagittula stellata]EBA05910.1 acetyltransferase, GNAT family protein [Sagittula stellata E-37]
MTLTVEETTDLSEPHSVRRRVFIEEQGFAEAEEWDELDPISVHLVVRDGGAPVASARLMHDGDTGKIGRICVLVNHRGRGLGAALVKHGVAYCRNAQGVARVYLSAQDHAIPFYERLGFAAYGEVYLDGTVPHRDMELRF